MGRTRASPAPEATFLAIASSWRVERLKLAQPAVPIPALSPSASQGVVVAWAPLLGVGTPATLPARAGPRRHRLVPLPEPGHPIGATAVTGPVQLVPVRAVAATGLGGRALLEVALAAQALAARVRLPASRAGLGARFGLGARLVMGALLVALLAALVALASLPEVTASALVAPRGEARLVLTMA